MPGTRSMRWLVVLFCGSLAVAACSTNTQQGEAGGSLSLDLVLADDVVINSVSWELSGNDMEPMSGLIDTSASGSTASVEVFGLPPGDDYLVELEATSEDGEVTCLGSAEFDVEVGVTTDVMVMLNCKLPVGDGAVNVNGKFNICAQLHKVVVSPLRTSVGSDIDLTALGEDLEGDSIAYSWTGTGGSIADPSAPATTYTCAEAGGQTVRVTVSDDDFGHCMDDWAVSVFCVDGDLCEDVDCDDGNECTVNDCNPADGSCSSDPVEDGAECDGGDGTCSVGECIAIDRCLGVDCEDGNECTDNDCDPNSGECVNDPVSDGTECDGGDGACSNGDCVAVDLCEGVDCNDGNECTSDACDPADGSCSNTAVDNGTSCNGGEGECIQGTCVDIDLCETVDCSSDNDCVEDGECDPSNGMCVDGDDLPDGTPCGFGGACDGGGNCVINICAELTQVVVSPLDTSVGGDIALSAMGSDANGDPIEFLWTGTGGSIADPNAASTVYTCGEAGNQSVTVTVSDDDFEFCTDELTVPVTCVGVD